MAVIRNVRRARTSSASGNAEIRRRGDVAAPSGLLFRVGMVYRRFTGHLVLWAGSHLSDAVARYVALALAVPDFLCSRRGRAIHGEYRAVMGAGRYEALRRGVHWMALDYIDRIGLQRAGHVRRGGSAMEFEHVGNPEALALLATDRPFVLVFGHFRRDLLVGFFSMRQTGESLCILAAPPGNAARSTAADRFGLLERVVVRGSTAGRILTTARGDILEAARALRRPGAIVAIAPDAGMDTPGATLRPFAASRAKPIPLGPARLARMAKVPLVTATPERIGPGRTRVHWGRVVQPAQCADDDAQAMGIVLEDLERNVGRFRDDYTLFLGWERKWHRSAEHWCQGECTEPTEE